MRHFAKNLRTNQTDVERFLWRQLQGRRLCGYKFRRQQVIEPYIVDFVCLAHRLIIELDGSQHMDHIAYDSTRTVFLDSQGFRVLRFWNNEVVGNMEGVLDFIVTALRGAGESEDSALRAPPSPVPSPPAPLPQRGEGGLSSPARGEGVGALRVFPPATRLVESPPR